MRDPRYENMWGENPEEQERRRQWLGDVYDRAAGLKPEQTPIPDHGQFNQTPYNPSDRFGQTSYQPKNELNNDSGSVQPQQNQKNQFKQTSFTPLNQFGQTSYKPEYDLNNRSFSENRNQQPIKKTLGRFVSMNPMLYALNKTAEVLNYNPGEMPKQAEISRPDNPNQFNQINEFSGANASLAAAVKRARSPEFQQQLQKQKDYYNQKYADPLVNGLASMRAKDWGNVGLNALQGFERVADGATLGTYGNLADNYLGWNYTGRRNQYLREAEQAGIGDLAAFNDAALEYAASNVGPAKYLSTKIPSGGLTKPAKILIDDIVGSGLTNINHSGSLRNADEKFAEGTLDSPLLKMINILTSQLINSK